MVLVVDPLRFLQTPVQQPEHRQETGNDVGWETDKSSAPRGLATSRKTLGSLTRHQSIRFTRGLRTLDAGAAPVTISLACGFSRAVSVRPHMKEVSSQFCQNQYSETLGGFRINTRSKGSVCENNHLVLKLENEESC